MQAECEELRSSPPPNVWILTDGGQGGPRRSRVPLDGFEILTDQPGGRTEY